MAKKPRKELRYHVSKKQKNVISVVMDSGKNPSTWEQWFLLTSDRHWDNPKSNWEMQKEHMDEALRRGAGIIDCGDFFCAMQGKYDPRSSKESVRDIHQTNDYLDALVNTASDFFAPYAQNLIMIARGNHEASILKRHETDLIERLIGQLNYREGASIHSGGYSGFLRFGQRPSGAKKIAGRTVVAHYSHGSGGGGPVTKGVIQTNRRAVYLPDANIIMSGHIHESWRLDLVRQRLSQKNRTYLDEQTHILIPTYKEEYREGFEGWHVERGAPPKPVGAYWLRFFQKYSPVDDVGQKVKYLGFDVIRAQ